MPPPESIDWRTWATETFTHAHATKRPVLLVIATTWSAACRAMDDEVFASPDVVRLVRERVVPLRVDADRRPDIADRYGAGGWPSTLLLTADGDPLCGGTYIDANRLVALIEDVAGRLRADPAGIRKLAIEARRARRELDQSFDEKGPLGADAKNPLTQTLSPGERASIFSGRGHPFTESPDSRHESPDSSEDERVSDRSEAARDDGDDATRKTDGGGPHPRNLNPLPWGEGRVRGPLPLRWIRDCLLREFDTAHGGFGRDAKFPLAAPVAFALRLAQQDSDEAMLEVAVTTLDRMGWDGLSADGEGAFHHACAYADWTAPDRAHLLDVQADMIRLYLDAWTITGAERYRDRAREAWAYVDRTLHDRANGGFFASELDGHVDRVLLTDANAKMIRALLHAARVLDDVTLAETAARAAERILPVVYGRGAGVAHVLDTHARVRGLLTDQVYASAAALDLGQASGDPTYLDLSDELMRSSLRKLWDASLGAFVDRLPSSAGAGDVGLLADPYRPFALNAEAARLLERLGHQTGHAEFSERAADVRRWLDANHSAQGISSAEYGLVLIDQNP
jgi:uncharacterized protein YyaL (SSP411 family)